MKILSKQKNHISRAILISSLLIKLPYNCLAQDSLFTTRNTAAASWHEALPIGNGKLGAKVFGGVEIDSILLVDNSLVVAFENESNDSQTNSFAKLTITDNNKLASKFIKQSLNLNRSLLTDEYEQNSLVFSREYFASYPDRLIGIRLRCKKGEEGEKTNKINCTISLSSTLCSSLEASENFISLKGFSDVNDIRMSFFCRLILNSTDGDTKVKDNSIMIKDASEVTMYLINEAGNYSGSTPTDEIELQTERLKMKDYDKIRFYHTSDYRNISARFMPSGRACDSHFLDAVYRNYLFISWPFGK